MEACKKATETGACHAYNMFAADECTALCPYVQGGNCSMPSREHVCRRNKVRCMPMVRRHVAMHNTHAHTQYTHAHTTRPRAGVQCMSILSWYCDTDLATLMSTLFGGSSGAATHAAAHP